MAADPNRELGAKRLCIVSSSTLLCAEFVAALQTALSPSDELEIVVDRRRDDPQPDSATHAATDRRHNADVDRVLKMAGFAIVPRGACAATERTDTPATSVSVAPPTERDDSDEDQRKLQSILDFQRRHAAPGKRPSRDDSGEDRRQFQSALDFQRRRDVRDERLSREESDEDGDELERILKLQRRQEVRVGSWLILTVVLAAGLVLMVQLPAVKSFLTRARPAIAPSTSQHASVSEDPPSGSPGQLPNQQAPTVQDPTPQRAVTPQAPPIAENSPATLPEPALPPADAPQRMEPARPREAVAEARPAPRPVPSAPPVAGVTGSSDIRPSTIRPSTDARPSAAPNANSRIAAVSNPRFPGLPRVEVFRDTSSDRSDAYAVRISDTAGRPLVGAEVLLLARMADGTVENIPMGSGPEPGSYYGAAPSNRSAPVDLRVRVITSDKRVEIPLRP